MYKKADRVVVWFSAGVTSAVAAKFTLDKYSDIYPVHIVMCDTGSEHEDNKRFAADISGYLGVGIEIITSEKYENTFDVYRKTGWLVGPHGARCSYELKKKPRQRYENIKTDIQIFGFDANEENRAHRFILNNPCVTCEFPLTGITIARCSRSSLMKWRQWKGRLGRLFASAMKETSEYQSI